MIVQKKAPWEAFQPIAQIEFTPFRDAGRGAPDFNLNIQDCLWGMWKAMQNGLLDMNEFNVEDYEFYEKVENGDWNWITPSFIAFASPVERDWNKKSKEPVRKLPNSFQNCLEYFEKNGVKLVVRLNNMLYDKQHFLDHGMRHEELYFDDGTNPTDEIVRKFINMADEVVEAGGAIAVHVRFIHSYVHVCESIPVLKYHTVQGRIGEDRDADRSVSDLEIRLHRKRGNRVYANRPPRERGWPATTVHVRQTDGMVEMVGGGRRTAR